GFSNPVLQRRPRIQPSKNVRLNVVPQAHESGVVSAVVPQTGNSRVRILAGNTARDQVGPNREGRQIASPPLFVLEDRELRRLRSGVEHRGGSHKLLLVDASQRIPRRPQQHKLSPNRRDDLPAISLARDAEVRDRAQGLGGQTPRFDRAGEHEGGVASPSAAADYDITANAARVLTSSFAIRSCCSGSCARSGRAMRSRLARTLTSRGSHPRGAKTLERER